MKAYQRYLAIVAMGSGVFVFGVLIGFGYLSSLFVPSHGATGFVIESPLLPDGWEMYRTDDWSIGYAPDFDPRFRKSDNTVYFVPSDQGEKKTYFLIQKEAGTFNEVKIARSVEEYPDPVEVMIANYPGLKYTFGTGRIEFLIDHNTTPFVLVSDDPDATDIAPMFATFAFTE